MCEEVRIGPITAGEERMSEKVTGYIDHVIFRNEENGYTVLVIKISGSDISRVKSGFSPQNIQSGPPRCAL